MKTHLLLVLAAVVVAGSAQAQLTPDRMYYGVDRAIPMTVKVPEGNTGEIKIELLEAVTAKTLESAAAAEGGVNLATLFPDIWGKKDPKVVYAQLVVGTEKIGPAVVIQPMVDRPIAVDFDRVKETFTFVSSRRPYSGIRAWVHKDVVIETTKGNMTFELRPDQAPNTCVNFIQLVEGGFYTDIAFHRILGTAQFPFVVQVGDPTALGSGGPGYMIDLEDSKLPHDFGVLSMARAPDPNSGSSQVFICLSRRRCSVLDGKYTSFAQLISGTETLNLLAETPVEVAADGKELSKPIDAPRIVKARTVNAAPYGTGLAPVTSAPDGPIAR